MRGTYFANSWAGRSERSLLSWLSFWRLDGDPKLVVGEEEGEVNVGVESGFDMMMLRWIVMVISI